MAWLETPISGSMVPYAKRIKLTLDGSKIDEDLNDFPVLIHLGDSVGTNNKDTTDVFDALFNSEGIIWADHQLSVNINSEGTYDKNNSSYPSVIISGTKYQMWYSGYNGAGWRIIYCDSDDGINWYNHQMVIDIGDEGTYDNNGACYPGVIYDADVGKYKMWYSGWNGSNFRIIYCESIDGKSWGNHQMVVNIGSEGTYDTVYAFACSVIKEDSVYKMWYSGWNGAKYWYTSYRVTNYNIMYAESIDGISWTSFQRVVPPGSEGTYDTSNVSDCHVIKEGSIYKMWYSGNPGDAGYATIRIIRCISNNGKNWFDFKMVVDLGDEGVYDASSAMSPCVINDNNIYKMWYTGQNSRIIYAYSNDGNLNKKKIAVTDNNDDQQYVEIESWDAISKDAFLWTKCPTLASGVNSDLYLYYDKDAADNDTYVGETGSLAATNVWDDSFVGVFHLSQNPASGAGAIKNSTQYGIHTTSVGSMIFSDLVDGKIGNGIDFDGSNDYLYTPSASDVFDITDNLTLECVFKWNTSPPLSRYKYIISRHENPNSLNDSYALLFNDLNRLQLGTQGGNIQSTFASWDTSSFYYLVGTYKFSDLSGDLYINGDSEILSVDNFDTMVGGANSLVIGANAPIVDTYCPGIIDEVRVSNTVRSSEWIKTTYYSNWDDLISFDSYALAPTFTFKGSVSYVDTTLSGIEVRLYRRSDGKLVDNYFTTASGTFSLCSPYSTEDHYVVALYNDISRNAIIADWLKKDNE